MDDVVFSIPLCILLLLLPRAYNAIIGSRDAYLLESLLETCALIREDGGGEHVEEGHDGMGLGSANSREAGTGLGRAPPKAQSVVAVVGLLHVNGIVRRYLAGHGRLGGEKIQSVWISKTEATFVPPPGYDWVCADGQVWVARCP